MVLLVLTKTTLQAKSVSQKLNVGQTYWPSYKMTV